MEKQRQSFAFRAIGCYLRHMRRSRGLSIEVVSFNSPLSESTILKTEMGDNPSLNNYLMLFEFYSDNLFCLDEAELFLLLMATLVLPYSPQREQG